jgi:hypothetical protein
MRTSSPHLEKVINAGVRTVVYAGDADYICNYQGIENMINSLRHNYSSQYASTPWTSWTVDGVTTGSFKNAGPFSYVRVFRFVYPICKLPDLGSHHRPQGWPPCSCLHCRKLAIWKTCPDHVQPGGSWPTDLFDVDLRVSSENYTQLSIVISVVMREACTVNKRNVHLALPTINYVDETGMEKKLDGPTSHVELYSAQQKEKTGR